MPPQGCVHVLDGAMSDRVWAARETNRPPHFVERCVRWSLTTRWPSPRGVCRVNNVHVNPNVRHIFGEGKVRWALECSPPVGPPHAVCRRVNNVATIQSRPVAHRLQQKRGLLVGRDEFLPERGRSCVDAARAGVLLLAQPLRSLEHVLQQHRDGVVRQRVDAPLERACSAKRQMLRFRYFS